MRWTVHGLMAAMTGTLFTGALATSALAQVSDPESGVLTAVRDELAGDVAAVDARIHMCRAAIDEPLVEVYDETNGYPDIVTIDLARMPDYARVIGEIRDNLGRPRPVFGSLAAQTLELFVAFNRFTPISYWPEDLVAVADEFIDPWRTERDAAQAAIDLLDEVLAELPAAEPTPTPTAEPTPLPVVERETPVPDPFADL